MAYRPIQNMVIGYTPNTWDPQNFKTELNGTSSTYGIHEKCIQNTIRKIWWEVDAGETGVGGKIILQRMLKSLLLVGELNLIGSGRGSGAQYCECCNEAKSSIKCGEFVNRLLPSPEGLCSVQLVHGTETVVFCVRQDSTGLLGLRQLQFSDLMISDSTHDLRNAPFNSHCDQFYWQICDAGGFPLSPAIHSINVLNTSDTNWPYQLIHCR